MPYMIFMADFWQRAGTKCCGSEVGGTVNIKTKEISGLI